MCRQAKEKPPGGAGGWYYPFEHLNNNEGASHPGLYEAGTGRAGAGIRTLDIQLGKLYRSQGDDPDAYPNLQLVLTRRIRWDLIQQQYDEMIKYTTAL